MATVKKAGPAGAPVNLIYAALREHIGCNHAQFEALMGALEATGCIRRTPDLAFYVPWPGMAWSGTVSR
ncbi:MAG: hypothetical protein ACJ8E1_18255 [Xanthobacteraceae bacterium]